MSQQSRSRGLPIGLDGAVARLQWRRHCSKDSSGEFEMIDPTDTD